MNHRSDGQTPAGSRICPVSYASFLSSRVRRLIHNPEKILRPVLREGQTALDIGCGPGFFSMAMARIVGEKGRVIAADLQPGMLDIVRARARAEGVESIVALHKCEADTIGLDETVDFALAFYMVHEVPDPGSFLREIHGLLTADGQLLLVEPKLHVSASALQETAELARRIGFRPIAEPRVAFSRTVLFRQA